MSSEYSALRVNDIPAGLYRHYKGGLYAVIGVAQHSETGEKQVVYLALRNSSLWVRPLAMFTENVDGVPRFAAVLG